MIGQFVRHTIICIGVIVGLLASGFLLRRELSFVPISYASDIDLSGNSSSKNVTMQNIPEGDSMYSDLFSGADKQIEPKKQVEPMNTPVIIEPEPIKPEPIKSPVKKITVPRATYGTKCPAEKDRPGWSSRNNKNHMDEDCCSDYDEWPKLGCAYTVKDFQIMLPGPTPGHKKHK